MGETLSKLLAGRADKERTRRIRMQIVPKFGDDPTMLIERELNQLRAARLQITIDYLDAEDRRTQRTIEARRYGGGYIFAFCLMRQALRTFVLERVTAAYDVDGVEIEDLQSMLSVHFVDDDALGELRERRTFWRHVSQSVAPELLLLRVLAAVDGVVAPEETQTISEHARSLVSTRLIESEHPNFDRYVQRLSASRETVNEAIAYLGAQSRRRRRNFGEACLAVVEADGQITDTEVGMLRHLEQSGTFS